MKKSRKRLYVLLCVLITLVCFWWWFPWPNAWPIGIDKGSNPGTEG